MQRKIFSLVFSCAILAQMSVASAQIWLPGGGPGNWSTPGRWSTGAVPVNPTDNVQIRFGVTGNTGVGQVNVDGNFGVGNLLFEFGNTLNILGGNTLTVNNFSNPSSGTITGAGHLVVAGSGSHTWTSALMTGTGSTTFSAGTLTINALNAPNQVVSRTMNTNGTTNWTDTNQALTLSNAVWNNGGAFTRNQTSGLSRNLDLNGTSTFNNLSTGTFTQSGSVASTVAGGTFSNAGTVESAASSLNFTGAVTNSGTMRTTGGLLTLTGATTNSGTMIAQNGVFAIGSLTNSGTVRTNGSAMNLNGPITNSGSIRAENGNITISGNFTNNGGDLVALGSNTININTASYVHNGGKFIIDNGNIGGSAALTVNTVGPNIGGIEGRGTIAQNVTMNAGTYIAPGNSPGVLTFNNNLTMNGGELRIEIGGLAQGVDFDFINVLGNANMTGVTVVASLLGTFEPAFVGQQFEFFRAANALDAAQWSIAANDNFTLNVTGNSAFLVSAVPEPSSLALLGLCTGLGLFARKRRGVASV